VRGPVKEEVRDRISATLKRKCAEDPEFLAQKIATLQNALADPEVEARRVANMNEANARPDVLARRNASIKETSNKPDVKARKLAPLRKALADPDTEARRLANSKATNALPDVKARRNAAISEGFTPEVRKGLSDKMTKMSADPAYVKRRDDGRLKAARKLVGRAAGGRHTETDKWEAADAFERGGIELEEIAKRLEPKAYKDNPKNAKRALSRGLTRWRAKNKKG
jgi:hypothetical protein